MQSNERLYECIEICVFFASLSTEIIYPKQKPRKSLYDVQVSAHKPCESKTTLPFVFRYGEMEYM
jgi:hypothetical protein